MPRLPSFGAGPGWGAGGGIEEGKRKRKSAGLTSRLDVLLLPKDTPVHYYFVRVFRLESIEHRFHDLRSCLSIPVRI